MEAHERLCRVVGAGAAAPVRAQLGDATDLPALSDRDRELLELVARGLPTASIAATLSLAPKTVRNRLSELYATLGVTDRSGALLKARSAGLGTGGGGEI